MDKKMDWKAYRLTYTKQAKDILKTLSLEEKVSLMSGSEIRSEVRGAIRKKLKVHYNEHPYRAGGIKEKDIPAMLFADGTRGVVCGCKKATCFPVASMRGDRARHCRGSSGRWCKLFWWRMCEPALSSGMGTGAGSIWRRSVSSWQDGKCTGSRSTGEWRDRLCQTFCL